MPLKRYDVYCCFVQDGIKANFITVVEAESLLDVQHIALACNLLQKVNKQSFTRFEITEQENELTQTLTFSCG